LIGSASQPVARDRRVRCECRRAEVVDLRSHPPVLTLSSARLPLGNTSRIPGPLRSRPAGLGYQNPAVSGAMRPRSARERGSRSCCDKFHPTSPALGALRPDPVTRHVLIQTSPARELLCSFGESDAKPAGGLGLDRGCIQRNKVCRGPCWASIPRKY
jgi:hypothetical protein